MDLSPDLHDDLQNTASAMADCVGWIARKTMRARDIAASLEDELAEANHHLAEMIAYVERTGTTWAQDTKALEAAQAFLDRDPYQ